MKTQRMPEMPRREAVAMRTVLMATRSVELTATRASEEPAQLAAALARIAEVAARYAENEARFCVRMVLAALSAGSFDMAKRHVETYVRRVGFVGAPSAEVQGALRADLAFVRSRMTRDRQCVLDQLLYDVQRTHPNVWIAQTLTGTMPLDPSPRTHSHKSDCR